VSGVCPMDVLVDTEAEGGVPSEDSSKSSEKGLPPACLRMELASDSSESHREPLAGLPGPRY
jgi:hypothetical protein